jgi:hypothetical protein
VLVLFAALVPLFAVWEVAGVFGGGRLLELFFERRAGTTGTDSFAPPAERST